MKTSRIAFLPGHDSAGEKAAILDRIHEHNRERGLEEVKLEIEKPTRRKLIAGLVALPFAVELLKPQAAEAATNFLWYGGATPPNGLLAAAITLMGVEMESLTTGSILLGTTIATINNTYYAQGIWGDLFLGIGQPAMVGTLSAGANFAGWFLTSPDTSTFEATTVAPARSPDYIIPMPAATNPSTTTYPTFRSQGITRLPALEWRSMIQNNSGQALGNGGTTVPFLKLAPYAVQY